jgi:hypothetical protein
VVTFLIDLLRVIIVTVQTTKSTIMFITYIIMMMGLYCSTGNRRISDAQRQSRKVRFDCSNAYFVKQTIGL